MAPGRPISWTALAAASPSISGMEMSMTMTSGVRLRASSTASRPLEASPTTSISGSMSRRARSPERSTAWSSARRTRIFSVTVALPAAAPRQRGLHRDTRAPARSRLNSHPSSDEGQPPLPPEQAEPGAAGTLRGLHVEPAAVVLDDETQGAAATGQAGLHLRCAGMLGDVGQRLLDDPVEHQLYIRRQASEPAARKLRFHGPAMREVLHERLERRFQPQVIQHRGTQVDRHPPHTLKGVSREVPQLRDPRAQPLVPGGPPFEEAQTHEDGGERLGGVVVQLARDPLSLLLLGGEDLRGHLPQPDLVLAGLHQGLVQRVEDLNDEGGVLAARAGVGRLRQDDEKRLIRLGRGTRGRLRAADAAQYGDEGRVQHSGLLTVQGEDTPVRRCGVRPDKPALLEDGQMPVHCPSGQRQLARDPRGAGGAGVQEPQNLQTTRVAHHAQSRREVVHDLSSCIQRQSQTPGRAIIARRPVCVGQNRTDHPESARQTKRPLMVQGKSTQTRTPMRDSSLRDDGPRARQPLRVLVADKNAHFRETVRRVLARLGRCAVSGEASTIAEVIAQVTRSRIDLLLLDVEMVTTDRLAELKRLANRLPDLKVAVLLSLDAPEYRQAVYHHGGHFCVAKDSLEEQLPA